MVEIGSKAPDAAVSPKAGQWVQLSEYVGDRPLVVLFFPMAFTSVCTAELCAVAEDWSSYGGMDAQVLAISVDSPYTGQRFALETKVPFPILSDFNKEAIRAWGVVREDFHGMKGVAERAAFVVDRDGIVRYAWQGAHPGMMPPFDEIKAALYEAARDD